MVSESHFRVLSHFIVEDVSIVSISTLADQLEWSQGHTSRVVGELESYGYVHTKETGREKLVSLSDIEPVEQLESLLTEYSHMDLPGLIAGSGLPILYYLDERRTAAELAERSGVSRATVYRRLEEFQRVGVVGKSKSQYRLNDPFTALASIARGLAHHTHRQEAEKHTSGLNFYWESHDEYLFACDTEITADGFYETGPARFGDFGIPLLTRDRRHYFRTERFAEITPAELVCHTLLIDDSSRYRTYCMLLIQKQSIDRAQLRKCAEQYLPEPAIDLEAIIDELFQYLETGGETAHEKLPEWNDFKQTASEYEVTL